MRLIKPAFLEGKGQDKEYYLSLILRNEKATAVVFEKSGNDIKFIGKGERSFTNTIDNATSEEFLDTLDKAISEAESVLPPNIESHKTLFALKTSWVEDNKIKKEYLDLLKKAGSDLSLDPIGFLVFAESVVNLVQRDEGAPVSAILADIGDKYVTVYHVKAGKIFEARSSEIHESPTHTVDLILKHLQTPEVMPARMVIFGDNEEDLTQEFIGFSWSKTLPFLHVPQIMSLPEGSDIRAVLLGAATQMNAHLLFDLSDLQDNQNGKTINQDDEQNKDVIVEKPAVSDEFFGFVQGGDVSKSGPKTPIEHTQTEIETLEEKTEEIPENVKIEEEKTENVGTIGVSMADKLKMTAFGIFAGFKKIDFKSIPFLQNFGQRKLILIPIILAILVIFFMVLLTFNAKARVEIFVNPKEEQKQTSVTFSPNSDTNVDNGIIKAKLVSVNETGETTVNTTGKQDVGEKAKGTVTIFNNDTDPVTLSSSTIITAASGQKFTLDNSVSVASASGDIFSGTKPGKADVKVTAAAIGTEYNLPSGTKFSVGTNSNVAGKNDNAFSGGTKKSVTVVSKEDIVKAETELPKDLSEKARQDLSTKVESGQTLLTDFVSTDLSSEDFSQKVNDEAVNLTLKALVSFNFVSYGNDDMKNLVSKLFSATAYSLGNDFNVAAKNIKLLKNENISADLNITAKLLPKIDSADLSGQIAGESILKAKNQIGNINQVVDTSITISPNIPFISNNLPKNPKNIQIVITSR